MPLGELLATDSPGSLRSWTLWWGAHLGPVWRNLLYSVRTGKSARALLTATEGFKHLERNPEAAALFNQAIVELTRLACASIVCCYDFSTFQRIVDVGGGYGELLAAILQANPGAGAYCSICRMPSKELSGISKRQAWPSGARSSLGISSSPFLQARMFIFSRA